MRRRTLRSIRNGTIAAATILIWIVAAAPAGAVVTCDRYASPTGVDTNPGTLAAPYGTPQQLVNSLTAGQTGCLRGGSYTITSNIRFPRAGTSTSRIALASYPGERATLTGGYIYVPAGSNFVTIADLTIDARAASQNAVQLHAADTIFERNDLSNHLGGGSFGGVLKSCIHAGSNAGFGQALRPIIRENFIHDCGDPLNGNKDHAVYYENVSGGSTIDNVFWNTAAFALHFYPNAQGHTASHNVIDSSGHSGAILAGEGSLRSSNNIIERNVIAYNGRYAVETYWGGPTGSGNIARNNCAFSNTLGTFVGTGYTQSGNIVADPQYLDRVAHDFRMSLTSPCLAVVQYDTARKITVDSTPPDTTITGGPAGDTYATDAVFSFTATEAGTFECRLDAGAWAACSSPKTYGTVAAGSHTFEARAIDGAGNVDPSPASRTWTVLDDDDTAPSATWTTPVAEGTVTGQLNEANANCRVTASDDTGVQRVDFYLDGVALNSEFADPWSCVWDTTTAAPGSRHSLTAVVFDAAGNAAARSVRITVE